MLLRDTATVMQLRTSVGVGIARPLTLRVGPAYLRSFSVGRQNATLNNTCARRTSGCDSEQPKASYCDAPMSAVGTKRTLSPTPLVTQSGPRKVPARPPSTRGAERTLPICGYMHGKIPPSERAVKERPDLLPLILQCRVKRTTAARQI